MNAQCSKGWGERCAASHGRRCRCACGGANHGIRMGPPAQSDTSAHFCIEKFQPELIIIRDLGPWDQHPTVTNDAEGVIARLSPAPMQRVFYFDSMGNLDELVHRDGRFLRFAPGPHRRFAFAEAAR